jgi:hypothetical protein
MTSGYTYDNFIKAAGSMLSQFSPSDLAVARIHPAFGMSMLTLKQDYAKADTDQARALIHTEAERLRSHYGNYASRGDGTGYYALLRSPDDYAGDSRMGELLDRMERFPAFSYDKDRDPSYAAYKKAYLREGERASDNTLAQAAALTGGIPSTAAVTAASQAGDTYASRLSDKLPALYENAYGRYLDEFNLFGSRLSALRLQDETNYARFLDENEFRRNRAEQAAENLASRQEAGGNALPYNGIDAENRFGGDAIAQAARQYYDAHPNVKIDSRTLDNWLNANGYTGATARTFKAFLESFGAGYERGYRT